MIEKTTQFLSTPSSILQEVRKPQIGMGTLVAKALFNRENAIVEAGTGTGKSFAYLVPAILSGKRIVISTATKNLQHQLFSKDLPALSHVLGFPESYYSRFLGKQNYVCGYTLMDLEENFTLPQEFIDWGTAAASGKNSALFADIEEEIRPKDTEPYSAEDCIGFTCDFCTTCPYAQMRSRVKSAQIIVSNHFTLALDLTFGNMIFGEYDALIIDEAHKVADAFRSSLSKVLGAGSLSRFYKSLDDSKLMKSHLHAGNREKILSNYKRMVKLFPEPQNKGNQPTLVLNPDLGKVPRIKSFCEKAKEFLDSISPLEKQLSSFARENDDADFNSLPPEEIIKVKKASSRLRRLREIKDTTNCAVTSISPERSDSAETPKNVVYTQKNGDFVLLHNQRVEVSSLLSTKRTQGCPIILTSATLALKGMSADPFIQISKETGVFCKDETYKAIFESPFDLQKQAVFYVSRKTIPPPKFQKGGSFEDLQNRQEIYHARLCDEIAFLVKLVKGNAFCLMTSRVDLEKFHEILSRKLPYQKIIAQHGDSIAAQLLEEYKVAVARKQKPLLLGLKSFWEGVSLEGEDLQLVIIPKLPFPVPTDPVIEALGSSLDNAFQNLHVPEMLKDLKQGAGRLIRTQSDYGIFALLDARFEKYQTQIIKTLGIPRIRDNHLDLEVRWDSMKSFFSK